MLRELVASGVIAPGDVDGRSIKEVTADDIRGYTQCHFFAGAGLWSVGARLAGWPDWRPIWTASCPCQPFSSAGQQAGSDDPRHLWPDLYRLISAARAAGQPVPVLVGEQVAGSLGYGWFDGVRTDLAREEIAARTIDIPACAIDAPHERNRLWWCAVANTKEQHRGSGLREDGPERHGSEPANGHGRNIVLADTEGFRCGREQPQRRSEGRAADGLADAAGAMVNPKGQRWGQGGSATDLLGRWATITGADVRERIPMGDAFGERRSEALGKPGDRGAADWQGPADCAERPHGAHGRNGSWWADAEWLACHDGKARRAKPGTPMLVDGMVGRASVWRLAGNSIVSQLAAEVIASIIDAENFLTVSPQQRGSGSAAT